jgi:hypothetical protein
MSGWIEDGSGDDYKAKVNSRNQLSVNAETLTPIAMASIRKNNAFVVSSNFTTSSGSDTVFYLKNTGPKSIIIHHFHLGMNAATHYELFRCTGTPSGTEVTPVNLYLGSSNTANVTTYGDAPITGLTTGDIIAYSRAQSSRPDMSFELAGALIIPTGEAICAINQANTTQIWVNCYFYVDE